MKILAAMAVLAAAGGAARADEVVLRNGARFEGQVKESGDSVTVVMDFGSMTFRKIDVARIDRGPSALAEFDARVAELKADDLEGRFKLALWAKQKELGHRARRLLEEILARDPEHAGAREALGYRRHAGRWLTDDEFKIEQGYQLFRGEWMKRETADEIRKIEAERAAEMARIGAIEGMRIKAAEAEAAAYRAQQDAARAQAQAEYDDYYYRPAIIYRAFGFRGFTCRAGRPLHFGNAVLFQPSRAGRCDDRKRR
jgi:hypothetical protein